jgi:hypothetical protein
LGGRAGELRVLDEYRPSAGFVLKGRAPADRDEMRGDRTAEEQRSPGREADREYSEGAEPMRR